MNHSEAVKRSWNVDPNRKEKAAIILLETIKNNPTMFDSLKKIRKYIDPTGQIHVVKDLKKFCESYGLSYEVMRKMSKGSYVSHKGWKSADIKKEKKKNRESKKIIYRFRNPNGDIIETKNIAKLAEETKSDRTGFFRLINGRLKNYKGWNFIEKMTLESE
jgi:hypothetical protein